MGTEKKENREKWPIVDGPERAREAAQLNLITQLFKLVSPKLHNGRITAPLVKTFLQLVDLANHFEEINHEDSTYRLLPFMKLSTMVSSAPPYEAIQEKLIPRPVSYIPGIELVSEVVNALKEFTFDDIDESVVLAIDEACETAWQQNELEQRCLSELEDTHDSVQRAKLYLEMGRDEEAQRAFKQITRDEIRNPENALDLVDLIERYQGKGHAIHALKRWFLFEIVLHPIIFDLVSDLLLSGRHFKNNVRIDHLQSILMFARQLPIEKIREEMILALPQQFTFFANTDDVDQRLKVLGVNLQNMDIELDITEEICFYSLLTDIGTQLYRLAELASQSNREMLALLTIERSILADLLITFLPERPQDIEHVLGYGSYNTRYEWVVENLQELSNLLEQIKPKTKPERKLHERIDTQLEGIHYLLEIISTQPIRSDIQNK